jgi:type I restriction enzyme, S subunit
MMPVQIPPQDLQVRFGEMVKPLLLQMEVLGQKNSTLAETRDLLLPRLISGELDVSSLPFPADPAH